MKDKIILIFLLCAFNLFSAVDFDISFQNHGKSLDIWIEKLLDPITFEKYQIAKKLYENNIDKKSKIFGDIPKVIHQIWLGNKMPNNLIPLIEKWKTLPNWQYKLWNEKDILSLNFKNKDLYVKATNLGQKADIARLAILEEFGGLYVDTDYVFINISKIEKHLDLYDFIIGFEPIEHDRIKTCNAFVAVSPKHPLIQKINNELLKNHQNSKKYNDLYTETMNTAGPEFITKQIYENFDLIKGGIILPPTYLYPISALGKDFFKFSENYLDFIYEETLGIHYWAAFWDNKNRKNFYFLYEFK